MYKYDITVKTEAVEKFVLQLKDEAIIITPSAKTKKMAEKPYCQNILTITCKNDC